MKAHLLAVVTGAVFSLPAPRQQPGPTSGHYIEYALRLPGHRWIKRVAPHADVYVLAGSRAEVLVDSIADKAERAINYDLGWLGESFKGPRLTLFIVGTRAEMTPLVGTTHGGDPVFDEHAVFMVGSDSTQPPMRHEIMHLLSWQFWGTPATAWMSEGVAMLTMPRCGATHVDPMAAELIREGKYIPLETLWHDFVSKDEPGVRNYVEGASLVQYIDRRWGRAKLKAFWPIGAYKNIQQRLGVDLPTLERDWKASLAKEKPVATWDAYFKDLTLHGCE